MAKADKSKTKTVKRSITLIGLDPKRSPFPVTTRVKIEVPKGFKPTGVVA